MSEKSEEIKGTIQYRHTPGENHFLFFTGSRSEIFGYFGDQLLPEVLKATEEDSDERHPEVIIKGFFNRSNNVDDSQFYVESIEHP